MSYGAPVFCAALAAAVAIDLLSRLLRAIRRDVGRLGRRAPETEPRHSVLTELAGYLLLPPLAFLGFIPPILVLLSTAMLMGFGPQVKIAGLEHGMLLLWLLVLAFLWVQVRYLISLPGFWQRVRYFLLLVSLPLVPLTLNWLLLDGLFDWHLANAPALFVADRVGRLLFLGVLPYFMPAVHARLVVPVLTWASNLPREDWRLAVRRIGNTLFVLVVAGIFAGFVYETGHVRIARPPAKAAAGIAPAAIGVPHTCEHYYPQEAMRRSEQGIAIVGFRITSVGTVKDIAIVKSTGSVRLDLATALCVSHWTYRPASVNGQNIEVPWKAQVIWVLRKAP